MKKKALLRQSDKGTEWLSHFIDKISADEIKMCFQETMHLN